MPQVQHAGLREACASDMLAVSLAVRFAEWSERELENGLLRPGEYSAAMKSVPAVVHILEVKENGQVNSVLKQSLLAAEAATHRRQLVTRAIARRERAQHARNVAGKTSRLAVARTAMATATAKLKSRRADLDAARMRLKGLQEGIQREVREDELYPDETDQVGLYKDGDAAHGVDDANKQGAETRAEIRRGVDVLGELTEEARRDHIKMLRPALASKIDDHACASKRADDGEAWLHEETRVISVIGYSTPVSGHDLVTFTPVWKSTSASGAPEHRTRRKVLISTQIHAPRKSGGARRGRRGAHVGRRRAGLRAGRRGVFEGHLGKAGPGSRLCGNQPVRRVHPRILH